MTGPVGARVNRPVALVTDDFRLYHALAPLFEEHGLALLGVPPGKPIPAATRAVLGGPPEDPRTLPIRPDADAMLLSVFAALDERPTARGGYRRVVIGIDPGKVMGLAFVADGRELLVAEERSLDGVARRVRAWHGAVAAADWAVHVGDGPWQLSLDVLAELRRTLPEIRLLLVPETATNPLVPATHSRHTDAAIRIAKRSPDYEPEPRRRRPV